MHDSIKTTIEEWAGDSNIPVTDEQVEELTDSIETAYEMSIPCGYGVGQIQTRERDEIKQLNRQIDLLQRYIESKGYHITLHDDRISRTYMVNYGDRSYSEHEYFR